MGETFKSAMRSSIYDRWNVLLETLPEALDDSNIEGVHDVRVASRRLRAAMDAAQAVYPNAWYLELLNVAKGITGQLGAVRDLDVLLEDLQAKADTFSAEERPGVERLISGLESDRTKARKRMAEYLDRLDVELLEVEVERRFGNGSESGR